MKPSQNGRSWFLLSERNPQPALQHGSEQDGVVAELGFFAWRGMKEQAGPTGRDKAEMSLARMAGMHRGRELSHVALVNGFRKLLLRQFPNHVQRQTIVIIDTVVVAVEC